MLAIVAGLFRILFSYDLDVLISWIWVRIVLESQYFAYLWKSSLRNNIKHFVAGVY